MQADEPPDERVELLRTTDPVRAGLVRGVLEHARIPVSTPGLEVNGVMPHLRNAIDIVVRVRRRDLEAARRLVAEMEREVEEEPVPAENAPYREAAKRRPVAPSPRLKRVAAAVTFLFPGGGHFYVQRYAGGALVVAGYVLALVAIGFGVPLSGFFLIVPWLGDVSGALHGCEVAGGAPDAGPRRLAPVIALAAIVALSALTYGPLLPVLAGPESVTWCDYRARCQHGAEDECLLRAANLGPSLPEPVCLSCIARHDTCDEVQRECEAQCWPPAPAQPWRYDPLLGL